MFVYLREMNMTAGARCLIRYGATKSAASAAGLIPAHPSLNRGATCKTKSSFQGRPTICTPIGSPSAERVTGTTHAGNPSRLNHSV